MQPRPPITPDAVISVRYTKHGASVTTFVPGHAGHAIVRRTLPEALRALADEIADADARRPSLGDA
jgi:hypothetical protein